MPISVTFISPDGRQQMEAVGHAGESLLDVAHNNDIPIEGVCEGQMACSTCHLIISPDDFAKLSAPTEEERDMLDLTTGLRPTSRLGCQVVLGEDMGSLTARLPPYTTDIRS